MLKKISIFLLILAIIVISVIVYVKKQKDTQEAKIAEEFTAINLSTDSTQSLADASKGETIGLIEVEKIGLKTEIIEGVNEANLNSGVAHLPYSASLYEIEKENHNFALAGKSSLGLHQLEKEDYFTIYIRNKVLTYQVAEKNTVSADDMSVLDSVKGKSVVTIITSAPDMKEAERIVLQCHLMNEKTLDGSEILK